MTKQRVGAVVAFSGSDSINCADPGVECYGTAAEGVTRVRGSRTTEGTDPASCADGVDNDGDGTLDATGGTATRTARRAPRRGVDRQGELRLLRRAR